MKLNVKESHEQEGTDTGNNEMQKGNEELMRENVEFGAEELTMRSNNVETGTSEFDSPKK